MKKATKARTVAKAKAKPVRRNRVKELEEKVEVLSNVRNGLLTAGMRLADRLNSAESGLRAIHAIANSVPLNDNYIAYIAALGVIEDCAKMVIDNIEAAKRDADDDSDD